MRLSGQDKRPPPSDRSQPFIYPSDGTCHLLCYVAVYLLVLFRLLDCKPLENM